MKFALFGDDPDVLPLVRAIAGKPDATLSMAAMLGDLEGEVLAGSPAVRIVGGWEEMLGAELDAVIVCGSAEAIAAPAKQLAAAGQTLALLAQGAWDTELIYELSLLRDDTGVQLIPLCPVLVHPEFQTPGAFGTEAAESPILHLRCEREVPIPAGTELEADSLRNVLLPDVGLLRRLGGEYHQVTAVKSTSPAGGIVQATITLSGDNLPDALCTIRPTHAEPRWELTVSRKSEPLTYQGRGTDGQISRTGQSEASDSEAAFDVGRAEFALIEKSLSEPETRPDWTDLTRDFEVLDAVRRSFTKRRTIDLHFETTSERSLFKTQMTAIGCGVLVFTLFAVVGVLLLGSILDARDAVERAAEKADTIFYADEFVPETAQLTEEGRAHWDQVEAARHDPAMTPILVEEVESEKLSRQRKEALIERLEEEDVPNPRQRVEVYNLQGPALETVMRFARILVFLPLFVFLGLQLLLVITRPAKSQQKSENSS